ncbi:glycine--tRNA ligase subunit beta [Shigella boydii]
MKGDQKYFPVYANDGKLLPNFVFIANIESKDPAVIVFPVTRKSFVHASGGCRSSSTPTVKNVLKITCRACKPCCSSNKWDAARRN